MAAKNTPPHHHHEAHRATWPAAGQLDPKVSEGEALDEAHAKLKAELKSNRRAKRNERRRVNRIKAKTRNVSWNDLHEVLRQKAALESKKS